MISPIHDDADELEVKWLRRLQQDLFRQLKEKTGTSHTPATLPVEAPDEWGREAKAILAKYNKAASAERTLNSKRCSREVSRFVKEINSGKPLSPEVSRWWMNRY